jgi:hypothetical protein
MRTQQRAELRAELIEACEHSVRHLIRQACLDPDTRKLIVRVMERHSGGWTVEAYRSDGYTCPVPEAYREWTDVYVQRGSYWSTWDEAPAALNGGTRAKRIAAVIDDAFEAYVREDIARGVDEHLAKLEKLEV